MDETLNDLLKAFIICFVSSFFTASFIFTYQKGKLIEYKNITQQYFHTQLSTCLKSPSWCEIEAPELYKMLYTDYKESKEIE